MVHHPVLRGFTPVVVQSPTVVTSASTYPPRHIAINIPFSLRRACFLSCLGRNGREDSSFNEKDEMTELATQAFKSFPVWPSPEALVTIGAFLISAREHETLQAFADSHEHEEDALFLICSRFVVIEESLGVKALMDRLSAREDCSQIQ
jgi:hypothetical protein